MTQQKKIILSTRQILSVITSLDYLIEKRLDNGKTFIDAKETFLNKRWVY